MVKTLKDLELDESSQFSSDTLCSADKLRDVAKEWIEHFDSVDKDDLLFQAKKNWIKIFFNLEDKP